MTDYDRLVANAEQAAREITALPPEQRAAQYSAIKARHQIAAGALGLPDHAAQELVAHMQLTIEGLVATMESHASS